MNKTVKKDWVKALRSGKYEQGDGYLFSEQDNTYCCLGVLTDLYNKKFKTDDVGESLGNQILSDDVLHWSGMKDSVGDEVTSDGDMQDLVTLNDGGMPFSELADLIEEQL